ncbi:hydrogenase nickel incorporation protein HypB [Sciscionella marina]|uniref:hydrogenase nickel incorporation protein HypB n=1 Tax=Sciscionella marina TaxID=508770 RepID=UPI0004761C85|nr:hydrogenase nickel incorporation protein HypB [Sciscionella marina]
MCATCGCSDEAGVRVDGTALPHEHSHEHGHSHHHEPERTLRTVSLEQDVLAKNAALAERNRGWLAARHIAAINLMSSPGSGKTTLLERTVAEATGLSITVIEGDQETPIDADRIRAGGTPTVQINTGAGCHLDAEMFAGGLRALDPQEGAVVLIENVGNLVCPALFDLGEQARVVLMSVTEGADKPLKYPHMFRGADLVVLNKVDLVTYVDFDEDRFHADLRTINPSAPVQRVSATRGTGMRDWFAWLTEQAHSAGAAAEPILP